MATYGNFYAVELVQALGLESEGGYGGEGGLLRVGFMHYNTSDEVSRLLKALDAA